MAELGFRMGSDITLNLLPIVVVITNTFPMGFRTSLLQLVKLWFHFLIEAVWAKAVRKQRL
jgi:hypothetical protein